MVLKGEREERIKGERIIFNYSDRNDFTGFISAARTLWKLTVNNAIPTASSPASAKTHHEISIL